MATTISRLHQCNFSVTDIPQLLTGGGLDYIGTYHNCLTHIIIANPSSDEIPTDIDQACYIATWSDGTEEDVSYTQSMPLPQAIEIIKMLNELASPSNIRANGRRIIRKITRNYGRTVARSLTLLD